jgi:hypothetical protein
VTDVICIVSSLRTSRAVTMRPLLVIAIIVGCSHPHGLLLTTEHHEYRAGDRIQLRLTANRAVSFNLCDARLERYEHGGWLAVDNPHGCPDLLRLMQHGTSTPGTGTTIPIDVHLPTGTYRVVEDVTDPDSLERSYEIATAPFAIRGRPPEGATTCGTSVCGEGSYCCNDSCGTCAPVGQPCFEQDCLTGNLVHGEE